MSVDQYTRDLEVENRVLKKKLAIAERALKFYADGCFQFDPENPHYVVLNFPDYGNPGGKARRALERMRKVKP